MRRRGALASCALVALVAAACGVDVSGTGTGGYARELSEQERLAQQAALNAAVSRFDIVITTAQVPGKRPPVLVSSTALAAMVCCARMSSGASRRLIRSRLPARIPRTSAEHSIS